MAAAVHIHTPVLSAFDPRGLAVRRVDYCRSHAGSGAETRVRRQRFDAAAHATASWDPRLWAGQGPANRVSVHGLGGREQVHDSVDGGFLCTLFGEAGQVVWREDGQGNRRECEYDPQLRLVAVYEQSASQPRTCSERHDYAGADPALAPDNGCGRLRRRDDPVGSRHYPSYALGGQVAVESWQFLAEDEWPDWPLALAGRDALLEPETASTLWRHTPLGEVREQVDASGNRQLIGLDLLGRVHQVRVWQVDQERPRELLQSMRYDAFGHVLEEVLGNGVLIRREHSAVDGRLMRLLSQRGNADGLQDLHYRFDPAGNVLSIEDRARPVRHFANQRIATYCTYRHDSLGQLCEASGQESGTVRRGPGMQPDPAAMSNYRQTYDYDAGGNLLRVVHVGAQAHGRELVAAAGSNRCLPLVDGRPPTEDDFLAAFDRNGNPLQLQAGQALEWDLRNRLRRVGPLTRDAGTDDQERYAYDGEGQRRRKWRRQQAGGRDLASEVRYLPGLERHRRSATGERFEVLVIQAGSCAIRLLHWLAGRPAAVPQDQGRYALGDHLGSCALELDDQAGLISQEGYYPFGETAWSAARNEIEAGYRTLRYSGKERDASGLYYYGARYYRAHWQRWLNPDPAGTVDGLNLYCMVGNAPLTRRDLDGCRGFDVLDDVEHAMLDEGSRVLASGLEHFPADLQPLVHRSFDLATALLADTAAALEQGRDERLRDAVYATFGSDLRLMPGRDGFLRELHGVFSAAYDYLWTLQHEESWRLILSEPADPYSAAGTRLSEIRGARIDLSAKHLQGNLFDSAFTLLHEGLHAMTIHLQQTRPTDFISDYWYVSPLLTTAGSMPELLAQTQGNARRMLAFGPDERDMVGAIPQEYARLVEREATRLGLPVPGDAGQRAGYFVAHADIRHAVVMRTADALAGFALMVQRRVA